MGISYHTNLKNPDDIHDLYESLGWTEATGISKDKLILAMKNSYMTLHAYDDKFLAGTGRVISDGYLHTYLCGLGVHPDYRGRGIGTEIVKRIVRSCHDKGLDVQLNCINELVPFYEMLGFEKFATGMKK